MRPMRWGTVLIAVAALAVVFGQSASAAGATPDGASGSATRGTAVAAKAPTWWSIVKLRGEPLGVRKIKRGAYAGHSLNRVVVGRRYRVQGQLPMRLREALAGQRLVVEAKPDAGTAWTTVGRLTTRSDGRFATWIRVTKDLLGPHRYRIVDAAGATRSTRQSTTLPGGTVTAVAETSFTLAFTNDTNSDLLFTFAAWPDDTSGQYDNGQFAVSQDHSVVLTFNNPIQNVTAIGFFAQRVTCVIVNCSIYYANWDHAPKKKGPAPCNTVSPTFVSGGDYTIRVTPQMGTTGFDMFLLDANGNVICTGALSTKFSKWLGNHPTARWAAIIFATDAAVNAVAGLVAGGIYAIWGDAIAASIAATWEAVAATNFPEIVVEDADTDLQVACLIWNKFARQPADSDPCLTD